MTTRINTDDFRYDMSFTLIHYGVLQLADLALTNFSMLVQLYAGDHPDTLADENMEGLATALLRSQPKQQKVLLKVSRCVHLIQYQTDAKRDGIDKNILCSCSCSL